MIRDRAWLAAYVATHRENARVTAADEAFETAGREETQRKARVKSGIIKDLDAGYTLPQIAARHGVSEADVAAHMQKPATSRRAAQEAPRAVKVSANTTSASRVAFKAATQPRESELQSTCVAYLKARGVIVWEMFKGSARGGSVWSTKGIPDLYIPSWGWIELKTLSGVVSVDQYRRHEELRLEGQRIAVITTLNELIEVIA